MHKVKIHVHLNTKALGQGNSIAHCLGVASVDYASFMDGYVNVKSLDIDVELPDNVAEIGIVELEKELQKMRADHHVKEQAIIDSIASLRLLAAPKEAVEGDVLNDRDLRQMDTQSRFDGAEEADDAEVEEDDDLLFKDSPF